MEIEHRDQRFSDNSESSGACGGGFPSREVGEFESLTPLQDWFCRRYRCKMSKARCDAFQIERPWMCSDCEQTGMGHHPIVNRALVMLGTPGVTEQPKEEKPRKCRKCGCEDQSMFYIGHTNNVCKPCMRKDYSVRYHEGRKTKVLTTEKKACPVCGKERNVPHRVIAMYANHNNVLCWQCLNKIGGTRMRARLKLMKEDYVKKDCSEKLSET